MIVQLLAVTMALADSAGGKVRDVGAGFGFREAEHELKIASAHLWKHLSHGFLVPYSMISGPRTFALLSGNGAPHLHLVAEDVLLLQRSA